MPGADPRSCQEDAMISLAFSGETELSTCTDDDTMDRIRFQVRPFRQAFAYVVVDSDDIIVSIGFSNFINFDMLPSGSLRVYAFSTYGRLTASVGDNFTTTELSTPCAGLTTNFVSVNNGRSGDVVINSAQDSYAFCQGDGEDDNVSVSSDADDALFVITDDAGTVLGFNQNGNINLESAGGGIYRVYAVSGLSIEQGENISTLESTGTCGSGLSINFITIVNTPVPAGSNGDPVTISSEQDVYEFCQGDDENDFITVSAQADNPTFVITDDEGTVLGINLNGQINFETAGRGTYRVYAVVGFSLEQGENVSTLEGMGSCGAGLSSNFITVINSTVSGGQIATANGHFMVRICPQDGNPDIIPFILNGAVGETTRIIITDESNIIIGMPMPNAMEVDFDSAPVGICRAWGVAYNGEFNGMMGDALSTVMDQAECLAISSNFVLVTREIPEGGTVATTEGATEVTTCPGDGNPDLVTVVSDGDSGGDRAYVVTDTNNIILSFSEEPTIDFDDAPIGVCRIWGLSYQGNLSIDLLANAAEAQLADNCFDLSDNFITVTRTVPSGGTVSTVDGQTEISICPEDGTDDFVTFTSSGAEGSNFSYVVTDENNIILAVPDGADVNFENAGFGVCRLWGLTYEGILLAAAGDDASTFQLASECFALSDNFVTVRRELPLGGTVSLVNGATQASVCPNDGVDDILSFANMGATGEQFAYVITDDAGIILGFPASGSINFEGVPPGTCRVYGLTYSGDIVANEGDDINNTNLTTACSALSENWVTVIRQDASTGSISTEDGETEILVCPGDASPDNIRFDSTGTTLENFNYLITDTNNIVIRVAFTDQINFETFPVGTCRVWGLGYDGLVTASLGQTAGVDPLATECYALSENFVTVIKQLPDGGTILTDAGEDEVFVCSMDGVPDVITVSSSSASGANFVFIATTDDGSILMVQDSPTFDFDLAAFGRCRIYGLSYTGTLLASPGINVNDGGLASECSSLSDNFVTVNRDDAMGGTVSLAGGGDQTVTCPGDGVDDIVSFSIEGNVGSNLLYLITDEANVLLAVATDDSFNFEEAGVGTCRVWGLSFAGTLAASPGDTLTSVQIATGCSALSDNFITVVREVPDGATVSLSSGQDTIDFCSGDAMDDILEFTTTSTSTNYGYIIADEGFSLIGIMADTFDFSNTLTGSYSVYGVAYTGVLTVTPGLDIFTSDLSTGCFDLSENSITLNITKVDGGSILGNGQEEIYLCPMNQDDGFVCFTSNSTLSDTLFTYVITTSTNVILSVMDSACFDFGPLPLMELRVYSISYTGDLLAGVGSSLEFSELATGCASISDNFVSIFNDTPEAGEISVDGLSSSGYSCVVDGNVNVSVTTTSTSLTGYGVIVTDTFGIVQLVSASTDDIPFGTLPQEFYRFYGIAYTGNLTVQAGDDISVVALADNCYEVTTDFVSVIRGGEISAGTLSNIGSDEGDVITFCPGDNPIAIVESDVVGINYRYIVTNTDNQVVAANLPSNIIPFTAFGDGEFRIYGFNFTGTPTVSINQDLTNSVLSTECYAITDNFITVIVSNPDGGTVTTTDGETEVEVEIDVTGGTPTAALSFVTDADSLDSYVYVVTDEDNNILATSNSATIDFGPAGAGVCRVWGLAYTGDILAMGGDNAATTQLTDGCFALSDNFVTVTRVEANGFVEDGNNQGFEEESGSTDLLINVYPNPTAGSEIFLSLESNEALPSGQVFVRDINGRPYEVQPLAGGTTTAMIRLDISDLPSGMYFATFRTQTGMSSVRFMKN